MSARIAGPHMYESFSNGAMGCTKVIRLTSKVIECSKKMTGYQFMHSLSLIPQDKKTSWELSLPGEHSRGTQSDICTGDNGQRAN
ncbi:hypothetical protein CEXT_50521 [Caerostris extrusa]|uniref:Uncharacterized protein n=1 Tax=Caerostris extrusa TaxID=172846 RepID=A0AAV4MJ42_CAEEX|nr:hypothetical protein CEXT_50521 [Caerostris extrusa]